MPLVYSTILKALVQLGDCGLLSLKGLSSSSITALQTKHTVYDGGDVVIIVIVGTPITFLARVPSYALYTVTLRCIIIVVLVVKTTSPNQSLKDTPPALATHPLPAG